MLVTRRRAVPMVVQHLPTAHHLESPPQRRGRYVRYVRYDRYIGGGWGGIGLAGLAGQAGGWGGYRPTPDAVTPPYPTPRIPQICSVAVM